MPEARSPRQGNRFLEIGEAWRVQRLRPAKAVGAAFGKTVGYILKQFVRGYVAVTVHHQKYITFAIPEADIAASAGEAFRIFKQSYLRMDFTQFKHYFLCPIIRHTVGNDYFKAIFRIVLNEELIKRVPDETGLVADRHDYGDEWQHVL